MSEIRFIIDNRVHNVECRGLLHNAHVHMKLYQRHVCRTQNRYQRGSSEEDAEDGTLIKNGLHIVAQTITFITDRQPRLLNIVDIGFHW